MVSGEATRKGAAVQHGDFFRYSVLAVGLLLPLASATAVTKARVQCLTWLSCQPVPLNPWRITRPCSSKHQDDVASASMHTEGI